MKVVDLHPEALLDKEARGELTESERARLEAHLERCVTCRFEREARADFAAELDEDHAQISVQRLLATMDDVASEDELDETREPRREEEPEKIAPLAPPPSRRGRRLGRIVALAAAALLVGGVATAQGGAHVWARLSALWTAAPEVETSARTPPTTGPSTKRVAAVTSATPVLEEHAEASEEPEAPSASVPSAPLLAEPPPRPPVENARTLFDAMSEARRRGDYAHAMALHRRLQAEYPRSREAHVSHATAGRLLLDRGDAVGALESFDAYQARGPGALDEEVLVGRATALDRLGRSDEARASWQALLVAFPETPYASHARSRMGDVRVP